MYTTEMFTEQDKYVRYLRGQILPVVAVNQADRTITDHTFVGADQNVVFFSTNHIYLYRLLPVNCVSCTTTLPLRIAPRPGFETGVLRNGEDYIRFTKHCNPRTRILESVEELVDYLNEVNATPRDPDWLNSMRVPTPYA